MATAFQEFEVCTHTMSNGCMQLITVALVTSYEQLRRSLRENVNKLYRNLR